MSITMEAAISKLKTANQQIADILNKLETEIGCQVDLVLIQRESPTIGATRANLQTVVKAILP